MFTQKNVNRYGKIEELLSQSCIPYHTHKEDKSEIRLSQRWFVGVYGWLDGCRPSILLFLISY